MLWDTYSDLADKRVESRGVVSVHHIIKQTLKLGAISVSLNQQGDRLFDKPHQVTLADVFLYELQQRDAVVPHDLVVRHDRNIDQRKFNGVTLRACWGDCSRGLLLLRGAQGDKCGRR